MMYWIISAGHRPVSLCQTGEVQAWWWGACYAIHTRWLMLNHVNTTASDTEAAFHALTYYSKKNAWNKEMYVSFHVKYHIVLGNLKEYGYQGLNLRTRVHHLLNRDWCDKMSTAVTAVTSVTAVTAVKTHPDRYEKDFDTVDAYFLFDVLNRNDQNKH